MSMIFSWRRRRAGRGRARKDEFPDMELSIPTHFRCPISLDLMKDPVTLSTGITYDRESIEKWIDAGNITCPVTNQVLRSFDQIPNHAIRKMIQDWCVENKSYGIERIPTPRIPITPYDVSEICSRIEAATQHRDAKKCLDLLRKMKNLAKESERNKRCIVQNGAGCSLAACFELFASFSAEEYTDLLKEILSALTWTFPLGEKGKSKLGSAISLRCISLFLKGDHLSSRKHAVLVLKELISEDQDLVNRLMEIEGIVEALFQIVKVPICPTATKASLVVIYHMTISENGEIITLKFVDIGLIPYILEILVDGDKSICEKALGILDIISSWDRGREGVYENALTMPLLVKKILRVSDTATRFVVSILWKLCMGENENAVVEAMKLGAFEKLLVVLQVGCGERTKSKVTELLKLMNLYKDELDCFASSAGFKFVKRPN
ncbi:U-box domain-containing 21-like [Olea europaea subsp. europaea]|uniref:U-box domain-containing protein n=1 Tax=Olea europaea subsp. europaea TaxID=158383 RepID=A0A8S0V5V9_OLEEU|nr:U-box domain-containing 21-like [Olea europaea subsp. europaea]